MNILIQLFWRILRKLYRNELENQQQQRQDTFYDKLLNNDEVNNLLRQLADLCEEDSIEEKLNKTWKEAINLCRKKPLSTYEQISKFLIQTFYTEDSLEEYEIFLLLIRLQVFENELTAIYEEKINEVCNHSNDITYNKIDKYEKSVEDFNRLQKINRIDTSEFSYKDVHIKTRKFEKLLLNSIKSIKDKQVEVFIQTHMNFTEWTSGDLEIDNAIQSCQKRTRGFKYIIEWIPYENIREIRKLNKGGFGTIYGAEWIYGRYCGWNFEEKTLIRNGGQHVALKIISDTNQKHSKMIKEITAHLTINNEISYIVPCYGLTKDPKTGDFILILPYMPLNLREYLSTNHTLNWNQRYHIISRISYCLDEIHRKCLVHRDLHSANILMDGELNVYVAIRRRESVINSKSI
ncbi:116_t:CDS:2 [Dentiscutata erythropus]|uniref:116_t:CDS:1 n=1 Tax=Dentiscutata erythropus TaxID=1348616 RepID=A0A9N9FN90_9GLOM|nr:116_t:CDS:2 [Dentiscutata erythropus]